MLTFQSSPKVLKRTYTITASLAQPDYPPTTPEERLRAPRKMLWQVAAGLGPSTGLVCLAIHVPSGTWEGSFQVTSSAVQIRAPGWRLPRGCPATEQHTGKVSSKRSKTKTTQTLGEAEVGRQINLVAIIKEFKKKTQAWLFFAPLICWASSYKPLLESSKSSKGNSEWPKAKPHQLDGYRWKNAFNTQPTLPTILDTNPHTIISNKHRK